jgi:uncharacterized protein
MADARISVRLQPRARATGLVAVRDGVLVARVSAPPLDGRANEALRRLLANRLKVALSRVTIMRGDRSREKLVAIEGLDQGTVDALIAVACDP